MKKLIEGSMENLFAEKKSWIASLLEIPLVIKGKHEKQGTQDSIAIFSHV